MFVINLWVFINHTTKPLNFSKFFGQFSVSFVVSVIKQELIEPLKQTANLVAKL